MDCKYPMACLVLLVITVARVPCHGRNAVGSGDDRGGSNWRLFRGDSAMSGVADVDLRLPLERAWTFQAPVESRVGCKASPLIGWQRVFYGDDSGVFRCLALDTGKELWSFRAGDVIEGAGCFAAGGLVVFGSGDGMVYALERDTGRERWRFEAGGKVLGGLNLYRGVGSSGMELVVFGSYDHFCYALDAVTGEKRWEFETGSYINGAVAIDEGVAIFGGCDGFLYLLDVVTGKQLGVIEVGSHVAGTVGVANGVAVVGHYGNRVAAYRLEDRERLWEYGQREFAFFSSPAVTPDRVIIGGRDRRVHCIDRLSGAGIWQCRVGGQVDGSPVVCGELVVVGADDGVLRALSIEDGRELWSYELGEEIKGSVAVVDHMLVVTCDDGSVTAFRELPAR